MNKIDQLVNNMIKHKLHLDSAPANKFIISIMIFREETYLDLISI